MTPIGRTARKKKRKLDHSATAKTGKTTSAIDRYSTKR